MPHSYFIIIALAWICFFSPKTMAMIPIEEITQTKTTGNFIEERYDPFKSIFFEKVHNESIDYIKIYRGFADEASNLVDFCKKNQGALQFKIISPWNKEQMIRSMVATLQYIGLNITTKAIGKYAQLLEFNDSSYDNLIERLVGNYCSANLSVISLKELTNKLKESFQSSNNFALPTIINKSLFPETLTEINAKDKILEQELAYTVKLFRNFCSWGLDTANLRMLVPLLRNPVVMSFLIRELDNKKISYSKKYKKNLLVDSSEASQVFCDNFICRKIPFLDFKKAVYKTVGSKGADYTFKTLYCTDFRDVDFITTNQAPEVLAWITSEGSDDFNLQIAQFIALLTTVPDFYIWSEEFSSGKEFLNAGLDVSWDTWALNESTKLNKDLLYEEPLTIEKVDRKFYFNQLVPRFMVEFDVNLGEFDRMLIKEGKLRANFTLKLHHNFLRWMRESWGTLDPLDEKKKNFIITTFTKTIAPDVEKFRTQFIRPIWKEGLENLIVKELLTQLILYRGDFFESVNNQELDVNISLNFSVFALKYINYKQKISATQKFE